MLQTVQLMAVPENSVPVRQGAVWQCTVQVEDRLADAYVKAVPKYQIVREVVCALLAQHIDLPVLRPGVVLLHGAFFDTDEQFAFATLATDQRPLIGMRDDSVLRAQLSRWPYLALAIAFDEWIANSDRTVRNLLFRGASDFVLIDHGEAIPAEMTAGGSSTANLLARLAYSGVSRDEELAAVRRVQQAATRFDEIDMKGIENASLAGHWDPDGMLRECCRLLTDRLNHLDDLIAQRFGDRQKNLTMHPRQGATRQ